ncbi:MAG: DNA-3-methyladenine glycosylase 2 [Desulfuromonadales bacterium]|nr:DNA-3-methyladenine glycosylase 2 [Desulfuromonadales bacterium]
MDVRTKSCSLACTIELPPGFRPSDILAFHRRDPSLVAERVDESSLQKGMAWEGCAACLSIRFHPGYAEAELAVDGQFGAEPEAFSRLVRRMLGLTQRVEVFEESYRLHPQLGLLIARQPGLRVPLAASPFEALTWAITGQQISVGVAISLRRKLIRAAGLKHSGGLECHPDAAQVAVLTETDFRQAGFSQAKTRALIALSQRVRDRHLPLDLWTETLPVEEMREQLLGVPGIGPWTVNYTLLRGFGWLDGSLHGDVAVRRGLQALLAAEEKITEDAARRWLAEFSPWRALIAAHLWALKSSISY